MADIIKVEHLSYVYNPGMPNAVTALDDVSFTVEEGDFVGIIGATGSGKSTLITHMNGLNKPTSGKIYIDGRGTSASSPVWCSSTRSTSCSRRPVIKISRSAPRTWVWTKPRSTAACMKPPISWALTRPCWSAVPLSFPAARSAGWPWRDILSEVKEYHKKTGTTVLLVSHSMEDIAKYANRVLVMSNKKIAMYDTVEKVFARAPELLELGLSVPQVTKIFLKLREMGVDVPADVYTIPYAVKMILEAKRRRDAGESLVLPRADKQEGGADKC